MNAVLNRIGVAVCLSLLFWGCTHDEGTVYKTSEVDSEEDTDVEDLGGSPSSKIFRNLSETGQIGIVIRDFSVTHPDFENFSEEFADGHGAEILNYGKVGYDGDWIGREALHSSCGNRSSGAGMMIGADGNPMSANSMLPEYLQDISAGPVLEYGQCMGSPTRGFVNASSDQIGYSCSKGDWSNQVFYTPGMVQSHLAFDPPKNGMYDMFDGVHIQKAADLCDNSRFEEWFADVEGVNFRFNTALSLSEDEDGTFQMDYNYNNGGFFPLDSLGEDGTYLGSKSCDSEKQGINESCQQYGPQSLSIFCPPYNYMYASTQVDESGRYTYGLCSSWLANGGPKSEGAAAAAAAEDEELGSQHLRNFGYTIMGYFDFEFNSENEASMQFLGSDDLWVYVDGVLVADLGGTHQPAPSVVDINTLAENNHGCHPGEPLEGYTNCDSESDEWKEGSVHHVHLFKANRQTSGADFGISLRGFAK